MQIDAPAKINLTLRVAGKRADGFHELESVVQMLTLSDTLTIEEADELVFTCSDPLLENEENLVLRAARMLRERCPAAMGARIHLDKHIPAQAGLGGGSSDAATTLAALNQFWRVRLTPDDLYTMAASLGSDVSFFLNGPTAVMRGRGEQVTPIIHKTLCYVVLAKPSTGLSTPAVYEALRAKSLPMGHTAPRFPETIAMEHALRGGNVFGIARALVNDLSDPAMTLLPELFHLRERMLQLGCLNVQLCGSGSALFGICPDEATARHAAIDLTNDAPWTWAGAWVAAR